MEAYTSFAQVYDTFMDNVPYEDWSDRIRTILRQYGTHRRPGPGSWLRHGEDERNFWRTQDSI